MISHFAWGMLCKPQSFELKFHHPAFNDIAVAFSSNINRLDGLAMFPPYLLGLATRTQQRLIEAGIDESGITPEQVSDFKKIFIDGPGEQQEKDIKKGLLFLALWQMTYKEFHDSLNAILDAMIVGTWTAFEAMAGDLWICALNLHPKGLANLNGSRKRIALKSIGNEPPVQKSEPDTSKSVQLSEIHRLTDGACDLQNHMGDLLSSKVSFDKLSSIREAYSLAFSKESERVDNALSDSSLDALSAVRNAIVHAAGKVDSVFLDRAKSLSIPKAEIGLRIPLEPQSVRDILAPSIQAAISLMRAVDEWILNHGGAAPVGPA